MSYGCIFQCVVALATVFHATALLTAFVFVQWCFSSHQSILLHATAFCLMLGEFLWQHLVQKRKKLVAMVAFLLQFFDATPPMGAGDIVLGKKSTFSASCCVFVHEKTINLCCWSLVAVLLWW